MIFTNIQSLAEIVRPFWDLRVPRSSRHKNDQEWPRVWPTRMTHEFDPQEWPTSLIHEFDPRDSRDPRDSAHSVESIITLLSLC